MRGRLHSLSSGSLVVAASLLVVACTSVPMEDRSPEDAPSIDDASGREPVPTIQLLTKTAANDPSRFELSRTIVEAWQEAGIDAELLPVDDAQLNSRTFTGKDYDAFVVSYGPTPERLDPDNLLSRFQSANATDSGTNVSMFVDPAYDAAYLAQNQAADEEIRRAAVEEAQRILYDEVPVIPLIYPVVGAAYRSDRWEGIEQAVGYPVFNVWNATSATPLDDRDTLIVGTVFEPPTLNPVLVETLESQIPLSLIYDTPLAIGPDGETVERAAESVVVAGSEVTLTLRDGMTFSDGTPVTAEDLAFSVEYLRDTAAPLYAAGLTGVTGVQASGQTVTITLAAPTAHFADVTLTQLPILPRHVWASVTDPTTYTNESPVGSGPFVLQQHRIGESLTFTANPGHYDPPTVAGLELAILGSFDAGVSALTSGEIDLYDDVQPATQYQSLKDADGVTVVETQSHGWRGLHLNTSRAPFDDRAFREALRSLIPYEDLIDIVMEGSAEPGGSVVAPSLEQWHDPDLGAFEYDPAAAMETLSDAGYAFGPDGTLYYPESAGS